MNIIILRKAINIFHAFIKNSERNTFLNYIERTFNNYGIYPPYMKEINKDEYYGEIDNQYALKATDYTFPEYNLYLNSKKIATRTDLDKIIELYNLRSVDSKLTAKEVKEIINKMVNDKFDELKNKGTIIGSPAEKYELKRCPGRFISRLLSERGVPHRNEKEWGKNYFPQYTDDFKSVYDLAEHLSSEELRFLEMMLPDS